uniref:C2 domain containing 3 centriole elongation regulator n=1 Tax=Fundulus heteroclitus TaxID=8078 RepID=A0A3Q2QQ88_FUNHE
MKSKKQKSVKAGSNKRKVPSDVSPSTSLPPLVEGQLRCFLCVTVSRVLWTVHKPPSPTFIRLRWWGESSDGTFFFPRDGSQVAQKNVKSTARYPIRCSPKQFTSYLTDMGSVVLEVLTKPDHLPIARAQVAGLSRLSLSQPISGFYTLVSPTSEKLGEVQVSLNLEPLTEVYECQSSGPATDFSTERMQVPRLTVPSQPISLSAGSGKESAGSSGQNTPRGKDHLYFQTVKKDKETLENLIPTSSSRSPNSQTVVNPTTVEPCPGQRNDDIISVLLERGNKLRNAMVESALKGDMDSALPLKDSPLPLPKDNIHGLDCLPDMDKRAVDLLLGSSISSFLPLWDVQGSPPESLSGHSYVCSDSELNDPLYDQSLLENLFYKTPVSNYFHLVVLPNFFSRQVNEYLKITWFHLKTVLIHILTLFSPNLDQQLSADGGDDIHPPLSAERFKLLSSIRIARVTIESLALPSGSSATTTKKALKGKPPRPFPSKKCTYFVEYVFPATSASGQAGRSKAGDVEVTRAVSSKVAVGAVNFHQLSVFPVHFNAAAIKRWWETELIFKIYSRKSDQKKPVAVGEAVHPLRSLLQSKELSQSLSLLVQSLEGTQDVGPLRVIHLFYMHYFFVANKSGSERENVRRSLHVDSDGESLTVPPLDHPRLNVWTPQEPVKGPSNHPGIQTSPPKPSQQVDADPEILLHALLMVPDGKNFSCGPLQAPNIFLNCKLFWCDETARSTVSWGQANPTFNFVQVTPVGLTTKLLERMKNNMMVIEVWQKTGSSGNDRLLGLVKLPLHQFYMSFRDPKITQLLLQAQYPVLGVDCYMPVIDVFSGSSRGNLRVVLAMGRAEQIVSFQRSRDQEYDSLSHTLRPVHMLDHQPHSQTKVRVQLGISSGSSPGFKVYYYPNVRDQLVARGLLPLSKLCAMATMQRQHPNEAQTFSLPLIPRTEGHSGIQPQPSGLLDICIRYNHRPFRHEGQTGRGAASRVVTLVVEVHRASGLKAAARAISEENDQFSYLLDVGVNPFVTVHLSFLPESERRCTRTAARTFCPEFDQRMEMTCDLLFHTSSGETCSLAEQLEQASAVFTVWNRDNLNAPQLTETMLGTVKIPLVDLIRKRTGISGWFGLYLVREKRPSQPGHILVGGLEASISFAHHSDREKVIKAARGLGWETAHGDRAPQDDEECWEGATRKLSLTFSMPKAWLPVHCLFAPGLWELQRSTYCYLRYKFFDQDAFCSRLKHPCVEEGGEGDRATVSFEGSRTVELGVSQPLMWYLREEKLEVQVWVTFSKNRTTRPSDSDRLVGSAFVDLSSLAKTPEQKLSLSGVYPLFMRSAVDLQGAALRVHITVSAGDVPTRLSAAHGTQVDSDSQEEILLEEVAEADSSLSSVTPTKSSRPRSTHRSKPPGETPDITSVLHTEVSVEESFPVTVAVDRAMHLNLKGDCITRNVSWTPCCCVSYVTADSSEPVSTSVVTNTDCPVWDHQHECRLSKELLVDPQQSLVFKVWHKGEIERVIGFASVDLSPLLWGFPSVCGWYNITDFGGQCHGQIKVSVTPLRGVQELRGQRRDVTEEAAKNSSVRVQFIIVIYKSIRNDRHFEHMDKVRLYHQNLQEQAASHSACGSSTSDINPSSSFLFSARKLSELDNIQRYFNRKLSTPTFLPLSEQDVNNQDFKINLSLGVRDFSPLSLNNSSRLSGLRGHVLETIPSDTQSTPSNSPVERSSPRVTPEDEHKEETDVRSDKEAGEDDEEEEEEDFEEVVLKPRPLNEVTSLTDRTSPWTSILSDPDLVSVESVQESDMSEDEDRSLVVNLESCISSEKHAESVCHHSSDESARDTSHTERDDNRKLPSVDQAQRKESSSPDKSDDTSAAPQPAAGTQDTSGARDTLQPYP